MFTPHSFVWEDNNFLFPYLKNWSLRDVEKITFAEIITGSLLIVKVSSKNRRGNYENENVPREKYLYLRHHHNIKI